MAKSAIGPAWFSKAKFGRCDYDRFDDITSTPLLATKKMIGKVEVNCRFAFSKSVWGVIGENKNPAGIIYLDLNFQQPPGCRLQSATVTVILEKDSEENRCAGRSTATTPVQFTDYYGPKHLSGRETLIYTTRTKKITPEIQLLGQVGVGGVGLDKQTAVQTASRWKFTGHISTTAGHSTFNKLQWSLHENPYESQPTHGDEFHTAFALEHNAKRFYMTVKVKGKLLTISSKAKCLFKFGGKGHDAVTKVEWTGDYRHFVPLDDFAKGLPQSMENENLREVSVGVGDVLPATYHSVTGEPSSLAPPESLVQQASHSTPEYPQVSQVSGEPYDWPRTPRRGQIPHKTRHREPLKEMESVIRHLPAPTHENLGRASGLVLPPPIEIPARQPMDPASDSASGTTLVDTDLQDPFAATHNVVPSQKLNAVKAKLPYEKEEQRIARNMIQLWEWVGKMSILILGVMTGVFGFPLDQKLFGNMEGLVAKLKSDSKPKPWLEMEALSVRPTVRPTGLGESGDEEQIGLAAQGVDRRLRFAKDVCQSRVLEDY